MNLPNSRARLAVLPLASLLLCSCARKNTSIPAGPEFQKKAQEALILAKPGAVIELPEGTHELTATLSLSVENVTIRGKGMGKTILSFKNQKTGSAGIVGAAGGVTPQDSPLRGTKGE